MKARPLTLLWLVLALAVSAFAADPSSGTITTPSDNTYGTKQTLTYKPGPMSVGGTAAGSFPSPRTLDSCFVVNPPAFCDTYTIRIDLPADYWRNNFGELRVRIQWYGELGLNPAENDLDLYIIDEANRILGASTSSNIDTNIAVEEAAAPMPRPGSTLRAVVVNWLSVHPSLRLDGAVSLILMAPPQPPPATALIFENHNPPVINGEQLGRDALEPTIGANWKTGNIMYQSGLETLRVSFDDTTSPAKATWTSVGATLTSQETLDPILYTDLQTGRTFVSQLYAACSLLAFTDDDGATWHQNPIGCGLAAAVDHQTVGGGPWAPGMQSVDPVYNYKNSVFYCAQGIAAAACGSSINGGITWNAAVPMYTLLDCGGLHGHIKTGPDGTQYVPNANCGNNEQGVAYSNDNGLSWHVSTVPGSNGPSGSDPAVFAGRDGTVYFAYSDANGKVYTSVSRDRGKTWSAPYDVSTPVGVNNTVFPAVIAGDDNRAAVAFLGTQAEGDYQSIGFTGNWYLYVAMTHNGGETWTTYNATPNDPVQRGCIWMGGGSNPCRNLLDFMGITVDKVGRVLVGYADGCIDDPIQTSNRCVSDGSGKRTRLAAIARQSAGLGLFAQYDGQVFKSVPGTPILSGQAGDKSNSLSWSVPSNGGLAISSYKVYRGTTSGQLALLTTVSGSTTSFTDSNVTNGTTYYYKVSAVNSKGEGDPSNEVSLTPQAQGRTATAPQRLKALGKHDGILLTWSAPKDSGTSPVTKYRVYRGTASGVLSQLAEVDPTTRYNDTSAAKGVRYFYAVSAVNAAGESAKSNEDSAEVK